MSDKKKLLVVIDPGHTDNTYNAGAVKGYYESKAVYDLSLYEKAALEKRGIDVILTRDRNQNPGLYERGQMAVKNGRGYANVVFESNHSNAFNGKAYGVTIIRSAHLPSSEKLADRMIDAIVKVMKPSTGITYNRGVTTKTQSNGADWYGVIRGAVSGATTQGKAQNGPVRYDYIVEHGFHDNQKECRFLSKQENLKAIAEAKAAVIADYFGISDKGQSVNQGSQSDKNNQNSQNSQNKQSTDTDSSTQNKKKSYLVRVSIDNLNIRQSPTIHSAAVGFTGKGTFTITEEATGIVNAAGDKSRWGKLKSGRGWICLDYAEKVG
ncbi:MAG: N-acetylmuramoyl-L-alanine amidase family protein [Coprococcus sp.]